MDFSAVLLQTLPKLRKLASFLIGEQDADDLVQDTAVAALESRARYRGDSSYETWLISVMRRVYFSTLRRNKIRRMRPLYPRLKITAPVPQDHARLAMLVIRHLSKVHRATVVKFYFEELSYAEIARMDGVPIGTVRSRLSEARARMQLGISE